MYKPMYGSRLWDLRRPTFSLTRAYFIVLNTCRPMWCTQAMRIMSLIRGVEGVQCTCRLHVNEYWVGLNWAKHLSPVGLVGKNMSLLYLRSYRPMYWDCLLQYSPLRARSDSSSFSFHMHSKCRSIDGIRAPVHWCSGGGTRGTRVAGQSYSPAKVTPQ